jgi:hypothetical protein
MPRAGHLLNPLRDMEPRSTRFWVGCIARIPLAKDLAIYG